MNKRQIIQITGVENGYIVHCHPVDAPNVATAITETAITEEWMVFATIGAVQNYIAQKLESKDSE
jgi:hypothetical protein